MTEQETDEILARLDYLETAIWIDRKFSGYVRYAELLRKMPNGLPPEVAQLVAAGKNKIAMMQLVRSIEISLPAAQVVMRFFDLREGRE
jgi:hypothetical protein